MTTVEYLKSWLAFVQHVISMYENGSSETNISAFVSGNEVSWLGRVVDIKLDEEFSPGIALEMSPALTKMSNGKKLRSDYLFLNTGEKNSNWKACKIGDNIRFKATIAKAPGPFPEIQLSEYDDDPEIILMVGLYNCELIEVVS